MRLTYINLKYSSTISVGYDSLHMSLSGKFSYKKENQRTLSFNVDIHKLPKYKTVFAGSSSELVTASPQVIRTDKGVLD